MRETLDREDLYYNSNQILLIHCPYLEQLFAAKLAFPFVKDDLRHAFSPAVGESKDVFPAFFLQKINRELFQQT